MEQQRDPDFYDLYMKSPEWQAKRKQVLERDQHRCRGCNCHQDEYVLHVHHSRYTYLGDEPLDDLITLCIECHDAVHNIQRRRRYGNKPIAVVPFEGNLPKPNLIKDSNNASSIELSPHRRLTPAFTQWTDRRSIEHVLEGIEASKQQAIED